MEKTEGLEEQRPAIDDLNTGGFVSDAKPIVEAAQRSACQAVKVALGQRNWLLGRRIVEGELAGAIRGEAHGRKVVDYLVTELTREHGRGYTCTSLYQYAQFCRMFPEIVHSASGQSVLALTWTHCREFLRGSSGRVRAWYEREAASRGRSVKTLARDISSRYCERMLASHVEPDHEAAARSDDADKAERLTFVKSPMAVEFLGLQPWQSLGFFLCHDCRIRPLSLPRDPIRTENNNPRTSRPHPSPLPIAAHASECRKGRPCSLVSLPLADFSLRSGARKPAWRFRLSPSPKRHWPVPFCGTGKRRPAPRAYQRGQTPLIRPRRGTRAQTSRTWPKLKATGLPAEPVATPQDPRQLQ